MVCPLRYVVFALSAALALATLWWSYDTEGTVETGFEGMTTWQVIKDFLTGGYLWRRYKLWKSSQKKESPRADLGHSRGGNSVSASSHED
mmetsp:Transcript_17750/g.26595  ORF Transcript_17750/g.26595 Transcript_17750/m.26595 type:complete len:90 (-) Transcript_17750:140-409(-)